MMNFISGLLLLLNMGLFVFCFIHLVKAVYYLFSDYRKFIKNLVIFFVLFLLSGVLFNIISSNAEYLNFNIIKVEH